MKLHPLGERDLDLLLVCRHLGAGAPVQYQHLLGPEPECGARRIDGGVAAADDDHLLAAGHRLAKCAAAEERQRVHDAVEILPVDAELAVDVRAGGHEHRPISFGPQ